jgi:AhpD family alkylhydroperoxidase
MTRIPVHTVDSAPEGSRDALKALEAKFGKVLNIHGAMAHSPAVLETYAAIQTVLQDTGTFDARTREAIALAVANVDDCSYCQAAHTAGGKAAGLSQQQTVDIRRGQVDEPELGALLTLVREQAGTSAPSPTAPGRPRSTSAGPTRSSPRPR